MSDAVVDLVRRHNDALAKINEALAKGDQREVKAWRAAFKRIGQQLFEAGYYEQHKPVDKPE